MNRLRGTFLQGNSILIRLYFSLGSLLAPLSRNVGRRQLVLQEVHFDSPFRARPAEIPNVGFLTTGCFGYRGIGYEVFG
ncbi:MAG: hypothetical protein CBC13_01435 [Planctomycetia bacterium TMED53]|nr:MAG: hypothetical protein CBC13_01435 [Planctomycetia bacterium TMED53]